MLSRKYVILIIATILSVTLIYKSPLLRRTYTNTAMSDLKSYIVTFKDSASPADISALQTKIKEWGGDVTSEFSLIKGFAAKLPSTHTNSVSGNEHVLAVEEDKEVKIQN